MRRISQYAFLFVLVISGCNQSADSVAIQSNDSTSQLKEIFQHLADNNDSILAKADILLSIEPVPITHFSAERSSGGIHDFYSEGDYWWPDPDNPEGPYIRKDGMTNPNNFLEHRKAIRNLNEWVTTLVAAFDISKDQRYSTHALKHLTAFFLDENTHMNPTLLYAQAIKGRHTGRGIGIIDTIHLIELVKAIQKLIEHNKISPEIETGLKRWFEEYTTWMNNHPYGLKEKNHGNNHSTWWAAQVAAFASLTGREDHMNIARSQFKRLISNQMQADGGFTDELNRTKPYIYTLFHLEGYAILCELASSKQENLWTYEGKNGSIRKAWDFMMPFIKDKSAWNYPPDVQNFDQVPIQTVGHLLAAIAYDDPEYISIWKNLNPLKKSEEIKRNFPLWQPHLWLTNTKKLEK